VGWARPHLPIRVLSIIGLAFLLFLAGLEVDVHELRGPELKIAGAGLAASLVLGLGVGLGLNAAGEVRSALLVTIILLATSLGLVVPVLKDAGQLASAFGQLLVAGCTLADFSAVVLLSLFFSEQAGSTGTRLFLLGTFVALLLALGAAIAGAGRSARLSAILLRLQDTTAQIRVRGAVLLLLGVVALAQRFGLEAILGAFLAGVTLGLVDRDAMMTHPHFRTKLEGIGYGFLIPVFFVSSGLSFDLDALTASPSAILRVPLFLAALLVVRGVPALLYRGRASGRQTAAAALLQATSLPFIVAATRIGTELGLMTPVTAAALVAAGLLSVLLFPLISVSLLKGEAVPAAAGTPRPGRPARPGRPPADVPGRRPGRRRR
jgi:Kef-type K+ transport system membrane component KefB